MSHAWNAKPWVFAALLLAAGAVGTGCKATSKAKKGARQASTSQPACTVLSAARTATAQRLTERGFNLEAGCAIADNFSCHRKSFNPTIENGKTSASECVTFPPGAEPDQKHCLKVETLGYNTSGAATAPGSDPSLLEPGGSYNRDEVLCYHTAFKEGGEFVVQGEGSTLAEAFDAAVGSCQSLARKAPARKGASE